MAPEIIWRRKAEVCADWWTCGDGVSREVDRPDPIVSTLAADIGAECVQDQYVLALFVLHQLVVEVTKVVHDP